jgi:hypothetical protein
MKTVSDAFAGLQSLNLADLPQIFPTDSDATRNAKAALDGDRAYRRVVSRRHLVRHDKSITRATAILERLPAPNESIHIVTAGGLPLWSFVPAVLRLTAPATIQTLSASTLGFSRDAIGDVAAMLDSGQIGTVELLVSNYFRSVDSELYSDLHQALTTRGQKIGAARTHCKLLCMLLSDGTPLTIESSANLRSCKSAEQAVCSNDAGLLRFHQTWITDLLQRAIRQGG